MCDERTYTLPATGGEQIEVMVDADETGEPFDIYTYAQEAHLAPALSRAAKWRHGLNPVFCHATNVAGAWRYIEAHGYLNSQDEEAQQ